jgi:hypothetical protein
MLLAKAIAMQALPYRTATPPELPGDEERSTAEPDVLFAAGIFWLVSLVRVVGAFLRHETFGAEATLGLMAIIFIPLLLVRRERSTPGPGKNKTPAT